MKTKTRIWLLPLLCGQFLFSGTLMHGSALFNQESLSYIDNGEWASYSVDQGKIAVYGNVDSEALLAAGFIQEESLFSEWTVWLIPENTSLSDVEALTGGAYLAPLITSGDYYALPMQSLSATISFSIWKDTLADVADALGAFDSIHLLSAPVRIGPGTHGRNYFLQNSPVEIGFADEGEANGAIPVELQPEIVEDEIDGNIVFSFQVTVSTAWELFEKINAVGLHNGLVALEPNALFIGYTHIGGGAAPVWVDPWYNLGAELVSGVFDDGWRWLDGFGYLYVNQPAEAPSRAIHWHEHHSYQYLELVPYSPGSVWLYDFALREWFWTSFGENLVYPFLWSPVSEKWYYYHKGSTNPRWFYDFSEGRWADLTLITGNL